MPTNPRVRQTYYDYCDFDVADTDVRKIAHRYASLRHCAHVSEAGRLCRQTAEITIVDLGIGACVTHVAPVLWWALGARDGEPASGLVTVIPTRTLMPWGNRDGAGPSERAS